MKVFTYRTRVYFSDTDAAGIVYHASYIDWAEHARTEMLREALPEIPQSELAAADGILTVIKSINCRKLGDVHLDDSIAVESWVGKIQRFSCIIGQRISSNGNVIAEFDVKAAFIDRASKHPVLVPEAFRKALGGDI